VTSGVVDVEDNLQIKAWTPKTDYELKNDIMNTFSRDAWIDASAVQVEVENSRVHLKGHVPNYVQKTAAEEDAWWTNGVVDVVNDLEVSEEGGGSV
jgi:osmotically-inducible protein OsmY